LIFYLNFAANYTLFTEGTTLNTGVDNLIFSKKLLAYLTLKGLGHEMVWELVDRHGYQNDS